jgi:RNA polymerase sigma factor (sigma-70 family)
LDVTKHATPALGAEARPIDRETAPAETDGALIGRSLAQPRAFARVFDRHWPAIHAFCTSRAGAAGEDIAAESFRIAFDDRRRFDTRFADARPWLYGIATNLLRHHFRSAERGRRALARTTVFDSEDPSDDVLGRLEAERLGPQLRAALAALSANDRDALVLIAWAGLGYGEVARALDIPIGTVRSRIHRARAHVRAQLAREERP